MKSYMGVDPGGAMAIITKDGEYVCGHVFKGLTLQEIADLFDRPTFGITAVLEKLGPISQGKIALFKTGQAYGEARGMIASRGYKLVELTPPVWKRYMGLSKTDKSASRQLAQSLWPTAPLRRVEDHNLGDALLIAECARRKGL